MLNLAKFCYQKPKTLGTTLIWEEREFFSEKCIFYFVSTVLLMSIGLILIQIYKITKGLTLNISIKLFSLPPPVFSFIALSGGRIAATAFLKIPL